MNEEVSSLNLDYGKVNYESPGMTGHNPKTAEDQARGFTTGVWKKKPNFKCCLCPQDYFTQIDMEIHVFNRHHEKTPPEMVPLEALLFNAKGEKIEEKQNLQKLKPAPSALAKSLEDHLDAAFPDLKKELGFTVDKK